MVIDALQSFGKIKSCVQGLSSAKNLAKTNNHILKRFKIITILMKYPLNRPQFEDAFSLRLHQKKQCGQETFAETARMYEVRLVTGKLGKKLKADEWVFSTLKNHDVEIMRAKNFSHQKSIRMVKIMRCLSF